MHTLSADDWRMTADIVADAAVCETPEAVAEAIVHPLRRLFGADLVIWDRFQNNGRPLGFHASEDIGAMRDRLREAFIQFFPQHPFHADLSTVLKQRGVYALSDRMTNRALFRTDLWNEVYIHLQSRNQLTIGGPLDSETSFTFALNRLGKDFDTRARQLAVYLRERLVAVFSAMERRKTMMEATHLMTRALAAGPLSYAVIGQDGQVAFATRPANETLKRETTKENLRGLSTMMHRLARLPAGSARYVFGTVENNPALLVADGGSGRSILLLPPQSETRSTLRLSRREEQVLQWLREGKTNAEIATILGISTRTVEKHCGSLFGKLGVENRTAAAFATRWL